jgi:hypothetical protein
VTVLALEQTTLEGLEPDRTLDAVLTTTWGRLRSHQIAQCPVCRGEMEPEYGTQALQPDGSGAARTGEAGRRAGRKPEGGRCTDCGAVLR